MKIEGIMNTDLATVSPDTKFADILQAIQTNAGRLIYVVDQAKKLVGIISSYDLLKVMVPAYLDANLAKAVADDRAFTCRSLQENETKTAKDIMIKKVVSLRPGDHVLEAEAVIRDKGFNTLPVVDKAGALIGEIGRRNVLEYLSTTIGCPLGTKK